jgi:hypothetical protein
MTGDRLCELLRETQDTAFKGSVVKGSMKPPTPEACQRLALLVDVLWLDARDIDAGRRELAKLSLAMADLTRRFAEELLDELERPPVNALIGVDLRRIEGDIAALESQSASIAAVRGRVFFQADTPDRTVPSNRKGNRWPAYADTLAQAFIKVMKETNPDIEIGIGQDGPVTRFIAKMSQFITNESPKLGTIEQHLRRRRKASDVPHGYVASDIQSPNVED